MVVKKNLADLPKASKPARLPSKNPLVVNTIANAWLHQLVESGYLDFPAAIPELPYRASSAGTRCDRAAYYGLIKADETNPDTIADLWRMHLGSMVHEGLGPVLASLSWGWRPEITVDLRPHIQGSAHVDLVQFHSIEHDMPMLPVDKRPAVDANGEPYLDRWGKPIDEFRYSDMVEHDDGTFTETRWLRPDEYDVAVERAVHVVEVKTVGGYSFKMKATNFQSPAEGPSYGHILQGALAAHALGCERLSVAYFSMELLSPGMAQSFADDELARFTAEWHYSIERMKPIIEAEHARIARLLRMAEAGVLPARELHDQDYPTGATVTIPQDNSKSPYRVLDGQGNVTAGGQYWGCGYCRFRDRCIADGDAVANDVEI